MMGKTLKLVCDY